MKASDLESECSSPACSRGVASSAARSFSGGEISGSLGWGTFAGARCRRRREIRNAAMAMMAIAPTATPTPMPALAPPLRPVADVTTADDVLGGGLLVVLVAACVLLRPKVDVEVDDVGAVRPLVKGIALLAKAVAPLYPGVWLVAVASGAAAVLDGFSTLDVGKL